MNYVKQAKLLKDAQQGHVSSEMYLNLPVEYFWVFIVSEYLFYQFQNMLKSSKVNSLLLDC